MTNEKKTYVLYEYLVFFYKKKWLIVLLPLIGLAVGALLSFIMAADKEYEGEARVYVGGVGVNSQTYSDPDLISKNESYISLIPEGLDVDVTVPKTNIIAFELSGEDPQVIEDTLQQLSDTFTADLMDVYNQRFGVTESSIASIKGLIETIEESVVFYESELEKGDLSPTLEDTYKELLYMNRNDLHNYELRIDRMETDLIFFEKPEPLNVSVKQEPNYLKSNMLVGVVLGLLFSIISLMLWKYIFEARRDGIND